MVLLLDESACVCVFVYGCVSACELGSERIFCLAEVSCACLLFTQSQLTLSIQRREFFSLGTLAKLYLQSSQISFGTACEKKAEVGQRTQVRVFELFRLLFLFRLNVFNNTVCVCVFFKSL